MITSHHTNGTGPSEGSPWLDTVSRSVDGLVDPDDEDALVAAISLARGLDRRAIRGRARRELGVNRMINAYERDLMAVAADHSWARLAS